MHLPILSTCLLILSLASAPAVATDRVNPWQRSYELEALGSYDEALNTLYGVPTSARAYTWELRRGWLLYLAGDHGEAIEAYRAAVHLEPEALEPRLGLLLPLLADRRWVDAASAADGALALDEDNAIALGRLAWAQYNLGRYAEAEAAYALALADFPSDVDLRAGLGWCLLRQGRLDDAERAFEAVLVVAPQHAGALEGYAEL